ncbi:hypothetical protein AC579_5577 [Pseudocercospora musae]|uniref:Uncharacterized protein n=1 Tax=Pseudocercospora musae TaxID=113226 RepID=A0A139IP75_9PEZI|nr:hypothetical protein AC579_5577 [Pseudocercospora musae]
MSLWKGSTISSSTRGQTGPDNKPSRNMTHITAPNASPFLLKSNDVELLSHSHGFRILRSHLAQHYKYELCEKHAPAHLEHMDRWLVTRDVLHALLVPIVELFDKACGVAAAATHAAKLEGLEYAFTGKSRGAFVWLQCFLSSERQRKWCYTQGCPACVVDHSLDSEFSIRLLYAACLLSDVHYPFTIEGPTLPSFMFFLESLKRAIGEDELFGDDFFELMQPKAIATRDGVEELIHQCLELDALLSQASTPDSASPGTSLPASPVIGPIGAPGIKVKRSKMARKQMKLKVEEEQWMESMLQQCWEHLQPEQTGVVVPTPTQSLNAALKAEPRATLAVREVAPE